MIRLGFTGTSERVSAEQHASLCIEAQKLTALHAGQVELHHGDCINADALAHQIAQWQGWSIFIHPPMLSKKRAFCKGAAYTFDVADYLVRNRHIVEMTFELWAVPKTSTEELRSGTWSTFRHAGKIGRPATLFLPNGAVSTWRKA